MIEGNFVKKRRGLLEHLEEGRISFGEYGLYSYLIEKADYQTGIVFKISAPFLAAGLKTPLSSIKRWIKNLERGKYLKRIKERGLYHFVINKYSLENGLRNDTSTILTLKDLRDHVGRQRAGGGPTVGLTTRIKKKEKKNKNDQFEIFWKLYPKKVGKLKSQIAFLKSCLSEKGEVIIENLQKQLPWLESQKKDSGDFRPHPVTWLNGARWEDEHNFEKPQDDQNESAKDRIKKGVFGL